MVNYYPRLIIILVEEFGKNVRISIIAFRYCNRKFNKATDYLVKSVHNIEEDRHWLVKFLLKIIELALKGYNL